MAKLEADTGWKLRVLTQSRANAPELGTVLQQRRIGDGSGKLRDPNAVLVVADRGIRGKLENGGSFLTFEVGDNARLRLPDVYWGRLRREYGRLRFVESRTRKLARDLFHKMALNGPKLANKQLVLGRIVDAGAELAVMALVASRVQGELNQGNKANLSRALFWLESRRKVVDDLLRDVWSNNDAQAYALARELMDAAEELPRLETPDLQPRPREWGKDITSGRQGVRLSEMDDRTDERAAK